MAPTPRTTAHTLTPRDEQILHLIYRYRFITAEDLAYLLNAPNSLAYWRRRLSALAGGKDLQPNTWLCRIPLPGVGNPLRIFTLGSKARKYLQREAGVPVDWYFRPSHYRDVGSSHLRHSVLVTKLGVAAEYWSKRQSTYALAQIRLGYELARTSAKVIPDLWLMFENNQGDKYPLMIELDRGMEFQAKFKRHVKARLTYIESGEYSKAFSTPAVMIAYATTGQLPEYRDTRRATITRWTQEVLAEEKKEAWAGIFRFTSVTLDGVYGQGLFDRPVWHRPDAAQPVPLLHP